MKAVQDALDKHLQALAEAARRDPDSSKFDPDTQQMDARDLQRLAEQAREAARNGDMDQARQKMADLDKMLQELEQGRPEHGQMTERDRQRAQKRQRGQQQMGALQDIVRREGGLLDHAQDRADRAAARDQRTRALNGYPRPFFPGSGQLLGIGSPPGRRRRTSRTRGRPMRSSRRLAGSTSACSRRCGGRWAN